MRCVFVHVHGRVELVWVNGFDAVVALILEGRAPVSSHRGTRSGTAGVPAGLPNSTLAQLSLASLLDPQVSLLSCKFLNSQGSGWTSHAVPCIDWCASQGAHIISGSFGFEG